MISKQIKYLPKEALFNLLLQIEPREINFVCGSLNRKVREICQSDLFKKVYSNKYDLLKGKIETEKEEKIIGLKTERKKEIIPFNYENPNFDNIILKTKLKLYDEIGNNIDIWYENETITEITYTPFKQIYSSTYKKKYNEDELRRINPIKIYYEYYKNADNHILYIGRENMEEILTKEDEELFLNSYNKEVKEFLKYISRESWWNSDIQFHDNKVNKNIAKEFKNEINDLLNKIVN